MTDNNGTILLDMCGTKGYISPYEISNFGAYVIVSFINNQFGSQMSSFLHYNKFDQIFLSPTNNTPTQSNIIYGIKRSDNRFFDFKSH